MIEPEVTAALGRRCLAFLIDSSLVVATGLGVAFQQSTTFDVIGRDAQGQPLVDPAEFAEIEELLDFEVLGRAGIFGRPFVRFQEFGDSVRVFGADSYLFGLLAAVLAAVLVFAVVPMFLQRTIGMLPFGLGIRTTEGRTAEPSNHLLRTAGLAVDLVPFILPGAVGLLSASTSALGQRVGDRLAGTTVVDLRALELADIPTEKLDLRLGEPGPRAASTTGDTAPSFDPSSEGDAVTTPAVGAIPDQPVVAPPPAPSPIQSFEAAEAAALAATAATQAEAAPPAAATPPGPTERERTPASEWPDPSSATGATAGRAPATEPSPSPRSTTPGFGDTLPPPPVHRSSTEPLGTPSSSATPASAPTDIVAAGRGNSGHEPAERIEAPTAQADDVPSQSALPLDLASPLDLTSTDRPSPTIDRADATWQPPRVHPAPVWQPSPLEPAPIEAPDPHDGRTLDDVVLPDPSTGSLVSESPIPTDSPLQEQSASAAGARTTPTAKSPVWSDKWRAWMYWDPKRKTWLRHDTDTNTWKPVS